MLPFDQDALLGLLHELRHMVYSYILDPDSMQQVHDGAFEPINAAPAQYHPPQAEWPKFLLPGVIDKIFRIELVEHFCEKNPHFAVVHPRELSDMFAKDLFSTGVTLSGCMLPYLEIHGDNHIQAGRFLDRRYLDTQLTPLIHCKQKFASNFRLRIVIHTWRILPMDSLSIGWSSPSRFPLGFRYEGLVHILARVQPSIRLLRWHIESQGSSRKVDVSLAACRYRGKTSAFEVSREMEWLGRLKWASFVLAEV
ncbi:hypothetical protein HBI81_158600 [Parastagonospora nodorum]|nr:hypothetical protein HBH51_226060 [Parastagonospora nodorum]KAH4002423.1 hypothetical protein HBI10_075780 [Parastagonospora nodorum]KAH4025926.1 hypothetical protein HBI13_071590 [Parastagonospora nodorum]KAH4062502.1 hypothetical protein HBH50_204100 [Parastagonospora nodorum]KAH4081057.1 hypothetical protein HBH48_199740 [Parastagonospora nodorum]